METSGKKVLEELKCLSRAPGAGSAATAERNPGSSPHGCALAVPHSTLSQHSCWLLQCHPPAPVTRAGGSPWAGQAAGTHTQGQTAVADGWVNSGCHKTASFLTRGNFKV